MIKAEDILARTRRQPFVPFRIHMSDGSSYLVPHPEMALVSTRTVYVAVPPENGPWSERPPRDVQLCSILQITRVEEQEAV